MRLRRKSSRRVVDELVMAIPNVILTCGQDYPHEHDMQQQQTHLMEETVGTRVIIHTTNTWTCRKRMNAEGAGQ